ncbi:MAG: tRNA (N(6)-L-threonylcarbamoyladenosine(37)-C(2))-methylthiotransferase MtaB [Chitinophagaceae bacterium]|nr:tRNA (N(6)-L-threonylcarbamoyladenosine(37)-C(2))-methylthiotransferase MtaB [Chitinophagaceae bacterium]
MKQKTSIAFHTLGCKLNFAETSTLTRQFDEAGYEQINFQHEADVYVINTCSVTENADKECKQLIRRVKRQNPASTVVITGCYAQLKPEHIATFEGVDLVIGAGEKFNIVQHLETYKKNGEAKICSCDIEEVNAYHTSWSQHDRTRTFLKVQDGCDYTCSFCTIPLARGHSRSDSIVNVVANVQEIARSGVQEIVLTGVNLGDFGKGFTGGKRREENFFDLIQALDALPDIPRYRISSIEPNLLTDEIISFVARSNHFMPHFHIPLQSGSNALLADMRRRYKRELYQSRVEKIKNCMPHACIGVDVIVGFPGETDEEFQTTYDFLHDLDISYLHVFTYSEREHTKALELSPVIPMQVRKERNAVLRNLSEKKMHFFESAFRDTVRHVLFEKAEKNDMMEGYSDNYIRVRLPFREDWVNTIQAVKLSSCL